MCKRVKHIMRNKRIIIGKSACGKEDCERIVFRAEKKHICTASGSSSEMRLFPSNEIRRTVFVESIVLF